MVSFLTLAGCISGGGSADVLADDTDVGPEVSPFVSGLDLVKVTLTQGVDIVLMEDGESPEGIQAPILRKRDATVRLFVEPRDDWSDRKVQGVLKLTNNDGQELFTTTRSIKEKSKQGELRTTLNIDIPGEYITPSMTFEVELHEKEEDGPGGGIAEDVTWAATNLDLEATDHVEIVLFPVRYNADGSGRLPDTSETQLARMHDFFYAMYPVNGVTISVASPIDWNRTISANGSGWGDLLNEIADRRDDANVDPNTYYYGIFSPAASLGQFCGYGCVLGLSNLAWGTSQDWYKSSIGLGFPGQSTVDTMVHEVGHAHGREHAPCGLGGQSSDRDYPYGDAQLGTWGYHMIEEELYKPADYRDMMSYCSPIWVSDYTYYSLWQQIKAVGDSRRAVVEKQPWQAIRVDMDGTVHVEQTFLTADPSGDGTPMTVTLSDGLSQEREVEGYYFPYSHIAGGMVLVPEQDFAVANAKVPALALDNL
jgi:hypothetical protein